MKLLYYRFNCVEILGLFCSVKNNFSILSEDRVALFMLPCVNWILFLFIRKAKLEEDSRGESWWREVFHPLCDSPNGHSAKDWWLE